MSRLNQFARLLDATGGAPRAADFTADDGRTRMKPWSPTDPTYPKAMRPSGVISQVLGMTFGIGAWALFFMVVWP